MPEGDIYATTRDFARAGAIAYVHFRNVRGRVPAYVETFVDDGDVDMARIVRILAEEGFAGVLVPDHVPELDCPAPWHAGHAYTVGYMKGLIAAAAAPAGAGIRETVAAAR
jgi:mannonate dehydratase